MPHTVDTVIGAPVDGWRYHPKYVEQFTDINKLYIVASCWIIIATCLFPLLLKEANTSFDLQYTLNNFVFVSQDPRVKQDKNVGEVCSDQTDLVFYFL